jgi:hypothetical protein
MTSESPSRPSGPVRIGGASAFIGDSVLGPRQLVDVLGMQYLVFDYLSEMTMSAFVQARRGNPALGYATDFIDVALRELLPRCAERGIRLIANAGGLNPRGCAEACVSLLRELGCEMRVAYVEGDDCMALLPSLKDSTPDFYSGTPMPDNIDSANAYLGAFPIARALDMGADIVITGRIVDSATTLGALIHAFGWKPDNWDLMASGSLAGHLLECGAQATGGVHTDWRDVPDWENIGYPFIDFAADGTFTVCKPDGTGGMVRVATVSEQSMYEIGDPANYLLPDVTCDFSAMRITQDGDDRVRVEGVRGKPPTSSYKVSATWQDGFRCVAQVAVFGVDAVAKARRTGEALRNRTRALLSAAGFADFDKTAVTVIGAEDGYGPHARDFPLREAIARVAVTHAQSKALDLFSRESRAAGVSWAPGTTAGSALTLNGRPVVEPRYRLFACLVQKSLFGAPEVVMDDGARQAVEIGTGSVLSKLAMREHALAGADMPRADQWTEVPLSHLAYARSGDKGNNSNIAVFAREPRFLPCIEAALQPEVVRLWFGHLMQGKVERYRIPTLHALNFMLYESLDGGGPTSLRTDPLGKGMAQMMLEIPVRVPADWV